MKSTTTGPLGRKLRLVIMGLGLLICSLLLAAGVAQAVGGDGEEWVCTVAAQQKMDAGACANSVCRELCYFGQPTGFFRCFNW